MLTVRSLNLSSGEKEDLRASIRGSQNTSETLVDNYEDLTLESAIKFLSETIETIRSNASKGAYTDVVTAQNVLNWKLALLALNEKILSAKVKDDQKIKQLNEELAR